MVTADTITLTTGTSADTVTDLQAFYDNLEYHINEETGAPGQDLIVDFVSVTKFNYVMIHAYYLGAATHSITIQLYDWASSSWADWSSMYSGQTVRDYSFYVPCGANYIGTGGDAGKVRVRFVHTQSGNASHDSFLEGVALYNLDFRLDHHWGAWR
jgi:hypothetical protein